MSPVEQFCFKLVDQGTAVPSTSVADADLVIDADGDVIKDRHALLLDLAKDAWRYRDLQS